MGTVDSQVLTGPCFPVSTPPYPWGKAMQHVLPGEVLSGVVATAMKSGFVSCEIIIALDEAAKGNRYIYFSWTKQRTNMIRPIRSNERTCIPAHQTLDSSGSI